MDPQSNEDEASGDANGKGLDMVAAAAIDAYYPQVVAAGSTARRRAQAAQSVATLVAGSIVAALAAIRLPEQSAAFRVIALAALLFWFAAASAYMRAVGAPHIDEPNTREIRGQRALVQTLLERARAEQRVVDARQRLANLLASLAFVLTWVGIAAYAWLGPVEVGQEGRVVLEEAYRGELITICSNDPTEGLVALAAESANAGHDRITFLEIECSSAKFSQIQVPNEAIAIFLPSDPASD